MTEIDRLAWEVNTKEFTKSKFPWADPFVVLCERYWRFYAERRSIQNRSVGELGGRYQREIRSGRADDHVEHGDAHGDVRYRTVERNTRRRIERRTKLEEIERKLIASARESSSKALERLKADSGMADVDDDDDDGKENEGDKGAKDPALSTSRAGVPTDETTSST